MKDRIRTVATAGPYFFFFAGAAGAFLEASASLLATWGRPSENPTFSDRGSCLRAELWKPWFN